MELCPKEAAGQHKIAAVATTLNRLNMADQTSS
jgi:hypothetical protein